MGQQENILGLESLENRRRYVERESYVFEETNKIPPGYESEIRTYQNYCTDTRQQENINSLLDFLFTSILKNRVKINTWEKRLVAVKKYLAVTYGTKFNDGFTKEVSVIRRLYTKEEQADLIHLKGKSAVDKDNLLETVMELDVRAKAICLVNLVTANRPNEMVRLQIRHFDLEGGNLSVYMRKQKQWHNKRLNLETIKAVREYIQAYRLKENDYLVGRVDRYGNYTPQQVTETAYRANMRGWLGLTPYNLRKTQVASMHKKGADLSTIAAQTGHNSLETLDKHYLNVSNTTVDKYL